MGRSLSRAAWLGIAITSLFLGAGAASAQQPTAVGTPHTATLHGRLVDPSGLAVADATLTVRSVLSGALTATHTEADGTFTLRALDPGSYTLAATSPGLSLDSQRIDLTAGRTLDLGDLRLSVAGVAEQVVVSASRVPELQTQAPTKVLVVTRQDMQRTGYQTVGDVLSEVPGIVTRAQSRGTGLVAGEQIDGIDSKETAVLLDGLPLAGARGIKEGYLDLSQQDVGRFARVEVVKGAASALYGTDALGGVINLVSRDPAGPLDIAATVSGGSLGSVDAGGSIGGQWTRLTGFLNAAHHQRDGYSLLPNNPATVGANVDHQDLLAKLRYGFTPSASLGFTSTAYRNQQQGLGTTVGFDPADPSHVTRTPTSLRMRDRTQTYALVGEFVPTSSTTVQARVYSSTYDEDSHSRLIRAGGEGPAFDIGTLNEAYRRGDITIGQQWGSSQFIQAGYEGVHDGYRGDNRIVGGSRGQGLTTNDLWIQDRIEPVTNLVVTLGGRYQHNSSYGGHAVPKAGVVYRVNDHLTTRLAYGQGFRAPNLGELYYHLVHLEYGYQVIGNPTLEPETSQSYSGGGTFTAGRYELSVNLFRNNLHNLIDNVSVCDQTIGDDCSGGALNNRMARYGVPPGFDYDASGAAFFTFVNLNVDRAMTQGMDVDGRVRIVPSLTFSGAYTYLDARDAVAQTPLPYRSHHQGHVKLEYANAGSGLVANVRGSFFGRWPTDGATGDPVRDYAYGYQIWNLYASKAIGHGVRAFAAVDNLGNSRDRKLTLGQPTFDRPDYGRTFRVGLRYTFAE